MTTEWHLRDVPWEPAGSLGDVPGDLREGKPHLADPNRSGHRPVGSPHVNEQ